MNRHGHRTSTGCRRPDVLGYGADVPQRPVVWLAPVRGMLLTALATLLTATGHVIAGGTVVDLSPFVVLVPMLATVVIALAERCHGLLRTVGVLALGQAALHFLLIVLSAHDHHVGSEPVSGTAMVAAHAVVTLLVAVGGVPRRRRDHRAGRRTPPGPASPVAGGPRRRAATCVSRPGRRCLPARGGPPHRRACASRPSDHLLSPRSTQHPPQVVPEAAFRIGEAPP